MYLYICLNIEFRNWSWEVDLPLHLLLFKAALQIQVYSQTTFWEIANFNSVQLNTELLKRKKLLSARLFWEHYRISVKAFTIFYEMVQLSHWGQALY